MLSCPNESSQEWKDILAEVNGNRKRALELWEEKEKLRNDDDLNEEIDDENFEDFQETIPDPIEEEDDTKLKRLTDRIVLYLEKQMVILKNKQVKNADLKKKRLKALTENVKAAQGVESINLFIEDAYMKSKQAKSLFNIILREKDNMSNQELIEKLSIINNFANDYSILDELSKEDIGEFFSNQIPDSKAEADYTAQDKLTQAIAIRDNIKKKFITEGIPLMADFLLDYKSLSLEEDLSVEIEAIKKQIDAITVSTTVSPKWKESKIAYLNNRLEQLQSFSLDKKGMINILNMATRDQGVLEYLTSPLISAENSALSLFAKAIKSELEDARIKDVKVRREVAEKFEAFLKSTGGNRDNVEKLYEGMYETYETPMRTLAGEIVTDENGQPVMTKRMAFVQKFDMNKYNTAIRNFFKEIGPKPVVEEDSPANVKAELKEWNRKVGEWFRDNSQPLPEDQRNEIIAAKQREMAMGFLTELEYEAWYESVVGYNRSTGETYYKKELSMPSDKYLNQKWLDMYNMNGTPKNAKGEYHKYLTDLYFESQSKLPEAQRREFIIPSIEKQNFERMYTNGILNVGQNTVKEAVAIQAYDIEYGVANLSELGVKFIPVYYTQEMDTSDVSLDLTRSVLMFSAMSNRYDAMNQVHDEVNMLRTIIGERDVAETSAQGKTIKDAFAEKLGMTEYIKKNGESYSQKHLDAFIDMVVYGEMAKSLEIGKFSVDKITNKLLSYAAITTIAADLLKGTANFLQGNIQIAIEAAGAEFFNHKNLWKARGYYAKSIPSFLNDFRKPVPESFIGKLIEMYDPMQGNFRDKYGNYITASNFNKLFRTDTLFFNQYFGEHEIQVSTMLALMDATKVYDVDTKEELTLLQAHEKHGEDLIGKVIIPKKTTDGSFEKDADGNIVGREYTDKDRKDFMDRLHALNKRMHGVYNSFDKSTLQRHALGKLAFMYRKHLVPGFKRRWKRLTMDHELGKATEGYYITFWNTLMKDLIAYKFQINQAWSTYTPFQKAQIRKTLTELTIILSTWALILILSSLADDDEDLKKSYMYNFVMYQAMRMRSETSSYANPKDIWKNVKSPSAAISTVEKLIKFVDQFVFTWDPDKLEYKRKTGIYEKGDNKSWAYFLKLMGFTGNNITPEEAVKAYQGILNK